LVSFEAHAFRHHHKQIWIFPFASRQLLKHFCMNGGVYPVHGAHFAQMKTVTTLEVDLKALRMLRAGVVDYPEHLDTLRVRVHTDTTSPLSAGTDILQYLRGLGDKTKKLRHVQIVGYSKVEDIRLFAILVFCLSSIFSQFTFRTNIHLVRPGHMVAYGAHR